MWPFNRKPKIEPHVVDNPDGSVTTISRFELSGEPRPVREDVVEALDAALAALGGEVMHAIDPTRIQSFAAGGPPVWSVGRVEVGGERPYTLLLTYGFSHELSPEGFREAHHHEYSLAVPAGTDPNPWADALLRHLTRYVLQSGQDLGVGDLLPGGAPITCLPFRPEHHATLPQTPLVGLLTATDPVLGTVDTPAGPIEVRRLVGIRADEQDRVETWSGDGFLEEHCKRDPLLLTDLGRASLLDDPSFRETVDRRAKAEGSTRPAIAVEVAWEHTGTGLVIEFPGGPQAAKLLAALRGRLPFGHRLIVLSPHCPPIAFRPAERFHIDWSPEALVIDGGLDDPDVARILELIQPESSGTRVTLQLGQEGR